MLMTKFVFVVQQCSAQHLHIVVGRLSDGAVKYFYQATGSVNGMTGFMNNITDELAAGYFPKPGKSGEVDNWEFLGYNPGRAVAEQALKELMVVTKLQQNHA